MSLSLRFLPEGHDI